MMIKILISVPTYGLLCVTLLLHLGLHCKRTLKTYCFAMFLLRPGKEEAKWRRQREEIEIKHKERFAWL